MLTSLLFFHCLRLVLASKMPSGSYILEREKNLSKMQSFLDNAGSKFYSCCYALEAVNF